MTRPNLFRDATSELSQDAILCWLLHWADAENASEDGALHALGQDLVRICLRRRQSSAPVAIRTVKVERQWSRIDILAVINDEIAIVIEDKTGTREHSNQLARYLEAVAARFREPGHSVHGVYVQTGAQDDYRAVEDAGYEVVERRDLLELLRDAGEARAGNAIVRDFYEYLCDIEKETRAFEAIPIEAPWSARAWCGFYAELQDRVGQSFRESSGWGPVNSPGGQFQAFWWFRRERDGVKVYLQLEEGNLCFKIAVAESVDRSAAREEWSARIRAVGTELGFDLVRPARMGNGTTMTVARLNGSYREAGPDGRLDWERTLVCLALAQRVVTGACEPSVPMAVVGPV